MTPRPGMETGAAAPNTGGRLPRIGLVAASLEIVGGQSIEAVLLAEALREDYYQVLQVPVNPTLPRPLRWVRKFRAARTLVNLAFYLPTLLRLAKCDVVHVFSASYWSFLLGPVPAMVAGRLFGKRVVLHYHSGEAADHLASWGWLVRPCLKLADEIVVPSHYLAEVFDEAGYATRVITNFIRAEDFPYREREPLQPRLVSTRNLEPYYAVSTVVRAFALVKARYPAATLTVVGSGREEASVRQLASSLGVSDIDFVGQVAPRCISDILSTADIFLNASVVDNQPLSILEAFAAGLCVVSTSTGAIAEMVRDGRTAMLVRSNDPEAMAESVCKLLADPAKASAMRRLARQELEKYSWASLRALWAGVYGCRAVSRAPEPVTPGTASVAATTPARHWPR